MSQLLKTLNEQRGAKLKEAQNITSKVAEEKRGFTDDERNTVRGLNDEIEKLNDDITEESRSIANLSRVGVTLSKSEERDLARFDLGKLVRHLDRVFKGQPSTLDGIEAEMVNEGTAEMRAAGINTSGLALPALLLRERRDLSVTGGTTAQYGGELVATEKRGLMGDFYNAGVLESAGAMILQGLVGNVDLPVYTQGTAPVKKTENQAAGDVSGTFASLSLSPKRLPGYITISDQLLAQSSQVLESFLGTQIGNAMRSVREIAYFHGTGTSEPTGIAATTGIGSVAGGTNGAAPDWADIVDLETAVAIDNALEGSVRYFTNAKVRGKLKKTLNTSSTDSVKVWDVRTPDAPLNGYAASVTNAISSTLTKGGSGAVASAIFFGNAADFVIGYWGGISLEMVRDTTDAKAGQRTLVANQYYDAGLLRAQSFSAMLDALTA